MTIEASIILPLILVILLAALVSFAYIAERAFFDHEEGVSFLLRLHQGSTLNRYEATENNDFNRADRYREKGRLTGRLYEYLGTFRTFRLFKHHRLLFDIVF